MPDEQVLYNNPRENSRMVPAEGEKSASFY